MNATRTGWLAGLFLASLVVGCQQPAPPPQDPGPQPDPQVIQSKADQMKLVASGKNTQLSYKAPQAGVLYVVDATTGLYIYNQPVAAGEKFALAPASSRATIDKQTVDLIRGTNENDEYRVYFLPQ